VPGTFNVPGALGGEMDCPNCGVYNPEERTVCWRCDQELPKPQEVKKKSPGQASRRTWLIIAAVIVLWLVLTFLLPLLLGGGGAPAP